ncbi:MAG: SPOR domain-containing protein [Geminicoccaceae bacterium]|nr:MAG: SPOR domain-containing protein [Geminicoccaceae bacterium]
MLNHFWRLVWVGGVFGLFGAVVWSAFDRAPAPGAPVPVVQADPAPFKEVIELPPVAASVPGSTVLNLLVDGDDPEQVRAAARLDAAIEAQAERERSIAELEASLAAIMPGEDAPALVERQDEPAVADRGPGLELGGIADVAPAAPSPAPAPAPETTQRATEAPPPPMAARTDTGFRIQLAAVKPGEEMATFAQLERRFPLVLAGLSPRFQAISTSNGVLVRVQAGPIESQAEAEARCRSVREAGGDCFVVAAAG